MWTHRPRCTLDLCFPKENGHLIDSGGALTASGLNKPSLREVLGSWLSGLGPEEEGGGDYQVQGYDLTCSKTGCFEAHSL